MNEAAEFIPTRQSLLSRLKDWNDKESWEAFFDTYWKLIYNAAIKAGLTDADRLFCASTTYGPDNIHIVKG
jgi:hypothetical protein